MYMTQSGPQRELWEASGIGGYDKTGRWDWEFYPPPYDFLAPSNSVAVPPPVLRSRGVGGCGCGGECGGCGDHKHAGVGLFDTTSLSIADWGWQEWGAIAVGAYLLIHLFSDAGTAQKKIRRVARRRKAVAA